MNNKKGISLIVLVITILVMIILAGVVIVSLQNDNPINKAKYAKMVDSAQSVRSALSQYAVASQANSDTATQAGGSINAAIPKAMFRVKGTSNTKDEKTTTAYSKILATGDTKVTVNEVEKTVKELLGVDPKPLEATGYFAINPETGASVYVVTADGFSKELTAGKEPDGIILYENFK